MVLRLESVLMLLIVVLLLGAGMVKLHNENAMTSAVTKDLEFHDVTLTEVDTKHIKSHLFAAYGEHSSGVLRLKEIAYTTSSISYLYANRATYHKNRIVLEGNVSFAQKNHFKYVTQSAVYDTQENVLSIVSAFSATMNQNRIDGSAVQYDLDKKVLAAQKIHATIYTVEK